MTTDSVPPVRRGPALAFGVLTAAAVAAVLAWGDLSPRVEGEFFFADDDPQLVETIEIDRRFPAAPQAIVRAASDDVTSDEYRATIAGATERLRAVDGVESVFSISTDDPSRSALWSRLLLTPDSGATNLIVTTEPISPEYLLPRLEAALDRSSGFGVEFQLSGVPVIVELIRRSLFRDLVVFSTAALGLFALITALIYRSTVVVTGTLLTALLACAATLGLNQLLGIQIGLLTANIVTIVFVLTLSHIVFLTSNWKDAAARGVPEPVASAIRRTLRPSLWSMLTTLLGFLSLLVASARPLRELGMAGAIGAVVALLAAYSAYPAFLRAAPAGRFDGGRSGRGVAGYLPRGPRALWLGGLALLVIGLGAGLPRVDTDPGLLTYFSEDGTIRPGLAAVDRDGGSSTLRLVVRDPGGARLDQPEAYERLWTLQEALEAEPRVGVVVSPAVLLEHARMQPFAGFLSLGDLLDILDGPALGQVGRGFVSADRTEAHYSIRMRESERAEPRRAVIERVETAVRESGLEVALVGGTYDLQAQLGTLIASSLKIGLGGLLTLFALIAFLVAGRARTALLMLVCLSAIPAIVLGTFGHLALPVDMITSPAANVALAMGVDSMIHLVTRARILSRSGIAEPWLTARAQIAGPILAATMIICAGFGIFALSTFPPTQRFGTAVILGTLAAATMALIGLPLGARAPLAAADPGEGNG